MTIEYILATKRFDEPLFHLKSIWLFIFLNNNKDMPMLIEN